jgi:hypothetical protein
MSSVIDMSRRLEINHEPWTVRRLSTFYEKPTTEHPLGSGRLYLPPHQREWSWKHSKGLKKMRKFIDSILHNYPIHTVILNAIDDGTRERWQIYDGRHRVETLWRFVHNEFGIVVDESMPTEHIVFYRDLCSSDRARINDRQIPVATTTAASPSQLADVFIRLNSGKPLTQADYCWACRDTPLIQSTIAILEENRERFKELFGGADITNRKTLPNWVGLFVALSTNDPGNMTTSFERLSVHLDTYVPTDAARLLMNDLFNLYNTANTVSVVPHKQLKDYQVLGFINAFFLNDWISEVDKSMVITKWVRVISHIRTTSNRSLVSVEGAQNLNDAKLTKVRDKVNSWISTGYIDHTTSDASDDSDSD